MKQFDKALTAEDSSSDDRRSALQKLLHVIKNQLPRIELINVLQQYNAGGAGTEKLIGDLSAGLVVAGMYGCIFIRLGVCVFASSALHRHERSALQLLD